MSNTNLTGETSRHQASIRILLADDHTVMRAGTRRILEDEEDLFVVGEAADGEEAIRLAGETRPDLIILDIAMPNVDGIAVCRTIRLHWPDMRILILTGHDNHALVRALHRQGVDGYLLKSAGPHELVEGIRAIARGSRVFGADATRALEEQETDHVEPPTRREIEVLHAVERGLKNREIADESSLSINTVEFHLRNIFTKLGVSTRAEALRRARQLGWLDSRDTLC